MATFFNTLHVSNVFIECEECCRFGEYQAQWTSVICLILLIVSIRKPRPRADEWLNQEDGGQFTFWGKFRQLWLLCLLLSFGVLDLPHVGRNLEVVALWVPYQFYVFFGEKDLP